MNFLIMSPHKNLIDVEVPYAHTDTEARYKENLKKYGSDWYYSKNPVNYKFNRFGYRMKQLEEIDYNNYYAFFGCSFTVGIGLDLKDTFAYRIAEKDNVDYINASMGGGSVDFVYYNFINMMFGVPVKPKLVFINWPCIYRTFYWGQDEAPQFMLPSIISDNHWKKSYQEFIVNDVHVYSRFNIIRRTIKLLCEGFNVKLYEMSTHQDIDDKKFTYNYPDIVTNLQLSQEQYENSKYLHINRARDITKLKDGITSHPGFMHQTAILNKFYEVMA